ncbi:MAG: glycosyltransferase [Candidatus Binatia bacterium]
MATSRAWRVAHVIGQLTRGGAERQLALLVRQLDRARFVPMVYCLSSATEPFGSEIVASGVPLKVLVGRPVQRLCRLRAQLAADNIDLVHAWLYRANAYAGCAHLFDRSRLLITSARNCKVQLRCANTLAFRSSRAIVANSQEVAAHIVRHYWAPSGPIRVIYNAIDTDYFRPCPAGDGSHRPGPIVTIGRLVEQKDHALFLEAAERLAREWPEAEFMIIGDGPLRPALEAQARALGLSGRVTFTGERDDVDVILRAASLFWLTSRWEGMPNVVLEAMASGVPAIATDVGGTRELIRSGVDGFVVAQGDAEAFARQSRDLLRNEARRREFAAAARVRAEEFTSARMVGAVSQLYEDVLGW